MVIVSARTHFQTEADGGLFQLHYFLQQYWKTPEKVFLHLSCQDIPQQYWNLQCMAPIKNVEAAHFCYPYIVDNLLHEKAKRI